MYHNRDISWLGFNYRVLQEASDPAVPLLERVKFLSIFSSNMDEFFRVRYPVISLYSQLKNKTLNKSVQPVDKHLSERVQAIVSEQLEEFGSIIRTQVLPGLEMNGINLYYNKAIPGQFSSQVRELFLSRVLAFIQPVFIEGAIQANFFPANNRIYFFVLLKKEDNDQFIHAVVNLPTDKLPRFFTLESGTDDLHIVFLDDIIRDNLSCIFTGFTIHNCYSFKITRDAELYLDEEGIEKDILRQLEKQLAQRDLGSPTRLLYESDMPLSIHRFLAGSLGLKSQDLYAGGRYHNLSDLASFPVKRRELEYPVLPQLKPQGIAYCGDIFRQIDTKDLLMHFPYESYNPVLSFFNQAAIDPDVQSIAVALYRVASESHIVNALISAAKNKKQVSVFVELKARFDEANNIKWSKEMVKAGVRIIYSIPRIKVHSKIALIIRRNGKGTKGYGYVGTGNFNESTAKFYTDHAIFTARPEVIKDLQHLFSLLEKEKRPQKHAGKQFHHLLVSQYNMVPHFEQEIMNQVKRVKEGRKGIIRIKLNNLEDIYMIDLLYKASMAGVEIQLLVRSVCCIMPGKQKLSETIRVRRVVDRFLEHSRIFIFGENEESTVYIGSADWMTRNLQHRIEVCIPVTDRSLQDDLLHYFGIQWNDNVKAVELDENLEQLKRTAVAEDSEREAGPQAKVYAFLKGRA